MTNTAFHNDNLKLELYGVGESPYSSSLIKAHSFGKPHSGILNEDETQNIKHGSG